MKQKLLLIMVLVIISSLFKVKYNARQKNQILISINQEIKEEKKKIQLLETDLAHRTRPQVIRQMLSLLPNLKPTEPEQIVRVD